MDARSQVFIPEPIGLQTLAQQDVETQTHTQYNTPVCVRACESASHPSSACDHHEDFS